MCFFSVLDRAKTTFQKYKRNFVIPYFVFIRDMLSYLALLGLHFAICVQPSQLKFSNLEWAILVSLFGRLLIEIKQFTDTCCSRSKGGQIKLKDMSSYVRYSNLFRYLFIYLFVLFIYLFTVEPLLSGRSQFLVVPTDEDSLLSLSLLRGYSQFNTHDLALFWKR